MALTGSYSVYYWLGKLLVAEQRYDKNGNKAYTLCFDYDENDRPIGINIKGASDAQFTYYYYAKNVQGDVIGLYKWNYSSTGAHPQLCFCRNLQTEQCRMAGSIKALELMSARVTMHKIG